MVRRWRRRRPNKNVIRWKAIFILGLLLAVILVLDSQIRPIVTTVTANEAKMNAVDTINKAVSKELADNSVNYTDLVNIERDSSGKILAITTNMVKMNELKSALIESVQEQIRGMNHTDIGIPIGTLMGSELLHGRGFEIPLRITLSGNISADFKSSFESAGINQTKHQILLEIHTSVYSFLPGYDSTTDVDTSIPVAETVIVGEVPQVVANLG